MIEEKQPSYNQEVVLDDSFGVRLFIKREDVLHPEISGNKFRKLKYNLIEAKEKGFEKLLTFGGAYSNHIAATAAAGRALGIQTIGVIRGEELQTKFRVNPTLRKAYEDGMELDFVTRQDYRMKMEEDFLQKLRAKWGDFNLIPEGGTNEWAVKGAEEILTPADVVFDFVCCAVGTGGTLAGIIRSLAPHQRALGFPALKGDFLEDEIRKFTNRKQWELINDYHFGGYAKVSKELNRFIHDFYQKNFIPLEPIYTGKMLYGIMDLIQKGYFPKGTKILAIHTGGLQGLQSKTGVI